MTVPRSSQISKAIYDNEDALIDGLYRVAPRLKKFGKQDFEYGYQLKEFPDEEIRLAEKGGNEGGFLGGLKAWIGNLTSPLNVDKKS